MPAPPRQRLEHQLPLVELEPHHQPARQLALVQVVLGEDRLEHRPLVEPVGMLQQARLLADHAAAAQQQRRDGGAPRVPRHPQDVGVAPAPHHHLLRHPELLQQADLVAAVGGALELASRGRLRHLPLEALEQLLIASGQEHEQPVHQRAVAVRFDVGAAVARPHTALDVVVEARPVGALVVLEVPAGAHREDAPDLAQRAPQQFDVGEGTEVARPVGAHLAGDREPRERLLHAHAHVRKALVVLEQDVEGRLILPDERRFQQQRLDFAVGEDGVEVDRPVHQLAPPGVEALVAEIAAHPGRQALGLAHVEHLSDGALEQVNPRDRRQIQHFFAQGAHLRIPTPRREYANQ